MLLIEGLKEKKNLECCYFVFILDFINFVGFCIDVMKLIFVVCRVL